jgi:hypothetical protein
LLSFKCKLHRYTLERVCAEAWAAGGLDAVGLCRLNKVDP